ncbi:helix-turn-helix transcriptional regulator [Microbacterium sp. NPDC057407]|uniref:helix-turn-helix transcriptional regulator n=1 Tax=Microbacterium sp. NPDC057407 TaxID=3346120 RepID=UPI00366B1F22
MSATYFEFHFASVDPDETEQHLANVYGRIQIRREFKALTNRAAGDDRFQIADGRFDGSCVSTANLEQFILATPTHPMPWEEGRASGDMWIEPAIFQPESPYTAANQDIVVRAVSFDPACLQRTARLIYGRPDLVLAFDGPRPSSREVADRWLSACAMARACQHDGSLRNDLIRAGVYHFLAVTALESFRLVADRSALHASAERQRTVYRAATDFIHAFASLPITIDDVAEAAGSSVPELALAFHTHTDSELTPAAYRRRVRLEGARQEFINGDPTTGDTVAEIARRWGFPSASRLAAMFRLQYGVGPKWLLDR